VEKVKGTTLRVSLVVSAALIVAVLVAGVAFAANSTSFKMVRNPCVTNQRAHADVTVNSLGPVEVMNVTLSHMPKRTAFDLFVIEQPGPPFGVSWYLGDMRTDANGNAQQRFIGRFSRETFAVSPSIAGVPPASRPPQVDPGKDATTTPTFKPIHTLHLGLWFNSPAGGSAAGCPGGPTPFNGVHTAGVQALHTNALGNGRGPLDAIQ
jgi:hypothetical protein